MTFTLSLLRAAGAWLLGVILGGLAVAGIEAASHAVWPPPPGLDPADTVAFADAVAAMPIGALVLVVVAWGTGAAVAGFVASVLAGSWRLAVGALAGGVTLLGAAANLAMVPHPLWVMVVGPALVIVGLAGGALLGARVGGGRATTR